MNIGDFNFYKFSSTFEQLLHYLYTDQTPPVKFTSCLGIIELANRLVLPRLVTLVEKAVIEEMSCVSAGCGAEGLEVLAVMLVIAVLMAEKVVLVSSSHLLVVNISMYTNSQC